MFRFAAPKTIHQLIQRASLILLLGLLLVILPGNAFASRQPITERLKRIFPTLPDNNRACWSGTQSSGALYQICVPILLPPWNGELILYAHGYVSPEEPLAIPAEFGTIQFAANFLGYGMATTSYRVNGLAVLPGAEDILDLLDIFEESGVHQIGSILLVPRWAV